MSCTDREGEEEEEEEEAQLFVFFVPFELHIMNFL